MIEAGGSTLPSIVQLVHMLPGGGLLFGCGPHRCLGTKRARVATRLNSRVPRPKTAGVPLVIERRAFLINPVSMHRPVKVCNSLNRL